MASSHLLQWHRWQKACRGACVMLWHNRVCVLYPPSDWWSVGLGDYFGLRKAGFSSLSRFPPRVQGRTSCTSPGSRSAEVWWSRKSAQHRSGHKAPEQGSGAPRPRRPQGQRRKPPPALKGFLQTLLFVEVCAHEGKHPLLWGLPLGTTLSGMLGIPCHHTPSPPSIHAILSAATASSFHFSMATTTMGRTLSFMTTLLNITSWIRYLLVTYIPLFYFVLKYSLFYWGKYHYCSRTPFFLPSSHHFY